ncbi:DNA-processing protein DprA [Roseobacter sp. CCS2]|uniref:DNA-processing protein DprA n=1 Tax=Roseobacter sp. CCS2 TaxID=391593 RepID=UPI0000F40255|nr:DNA-processing protein DprA [Roseobacter sp. CCS2]EBA13295.1 DNA processing protein DprA, putative [Roseobacter sp. CCS2]
MAETHLSSNHPPLLPTTEDEAVDRLRLLRSRRVGVATYRRLLAEHGSAADALNALPDVAKAAGVTDYAICPEGVVMAELKAGKAAGAKLLVEGSPEYPTALNDISDAPPLLWALGNVALLQKPMIALVGARNASSLGTRMAKRLGADLAEAGFAVVSGLARGIDAAAHHGALSGSTIAVMAGGVDIIYPAENTQLAHDIAKRGLRLSEMPMGLQPQARHFPARNRIISGLSRAVVVVEAAGKSGSLITARNALDQGRDVLAVPGHPFDARAWGCNMLIRDGATLVRNAEDVIDAVRPAVAAAPELDLSTPTPTAATRSLRDVAALHSEILSRLGSAPIAEDQLLRDIKVAATEIAPVLVDLELEGKITRQSGGLLARVV